MRAWKCGRHRRTRAAVLCVFTGSPRKSITSGKCGSKLKLGPCTAPDSGAHAGEVRAQQRGCQPQGGRPELGPSAAESRLKGPQEETACVPQRSVPRGAGRLPRGGGQTGGADAGRRLRSRTGRDRSACGAGRDERAAEAPGTAAGWCRVPGAAAFSTTEPRPPPGFASAPEGFQGRVRGPDTLRLAGPCCTGIRFGAREHVVFLSSCACSSAPHPLEASGDEAPLC